MSAIYDISGTSNDTFSLNGKATIIQGDEQPKNTQGQNGDVYLQSNGTIWSKKNNNWTAVEGAGSGLPDPTGHPGASVVVNDTADGFTTGPVTKYVAVTKGSDNVFENVNTFNNTIQGTAIQSLWADLAECYKSDATYPKGTLIQFGGTQEITIAKTNVNAIVTSKPGFLLNSEEPNSLGIALVGRVPVRVIGKCNKFDDLVLSNIPGVATKFTAKFEYTFAGLSLVNDELDDNPHLNKEIALNSNVIAKALENKYNDDEGLVLCVVKLSL